MDLYLFYAFAATIVLFSILTVTSRRILRAAVSLLFVLVATSGLYVWLNYHFLAAVQLTVYAGGIVVLIIFSILLTSHINEKFEKVKLIKGLSAAIVAVLGAGLSIYTIINHAFTPTDKAPVESSVELIGTQLLSYGENGYILPFEVISILLLAAMIAAIVVAKKKKGEVKLPEQNQQTSKI